MKNLLIYIFSSILFLWSCTERITLDTQTMSARYVAVEGVLTNIPSVQTINISNPSGFFDETISPSPVSGASVTVSDGSKTVSFVEDPDRPGTYCSPNYYYGIPGKTYTLTIEVTDADGSVELYSAESVMPEPGFLIDALDYKYMDPLMKDSWTMAVWGQDTPDVSNYFIMFGVNGHMYPFDKGLALPDFYFDAQYINAYPINILVQNEENMRKFGECAKPLETGDVVSVSAFTLTQDFYEYLWAFMTNTSQISIPLLTPPPANLPTNIKGKNAQGFFAACPVSLKTCVVDDPFRTDFRPDLPKPRP